MRLLIAKHCSKISPERSNSGRQGCTACAESGVISSDITRGAEKADLRVLNPYAPTECYVRNASRNSEVLRMPLGFLFYNRDRFTYLYNEAGRAA